MTMTKRNPTEVAACGCPYDPEYDFGSLGWHLTENHIPEEIDLLRSDLARTSERLDAINRALRARTDIYDGEEAER